MRPLLLACALLAAPGCPKWDERSTLDQVLERGVLIVGTEPEFPPFESIDQNGEYVGFDMDMVRELARDLGVRLRIEPMAFDSLPTALATGKIDLIASGMTATAERAKSRAFSEPYFHTGLCLLVNAKSGIEKPADVNGKRVVVKLGTTGDINAPRLFKDIEITRLDTEGACALEVIQGRADAFLYDQLSILRHHRNNPETTRALLEPLTKEPYAMACRLGDDKFVNRLNEFLATIRADGRYRRIYQQHFAELPDGSR
ncbi:MAG: transporter substrate-binding domain-containing protein [Planctomycetota bacterium]|jgi:polar amino acid transport system substrate-binding protein